MGKNRKKNPSRVETDEYLNILEAFYKLQRFVMLTADVIYFQFKYVHDNIRKENKVCDS